MNPFGRMCGTIDPGSCIQWVLGFGVKPGYWTYRSHAGVVGPVSQVVYRQQRVALPPLLQWLDRERNWVRTHRLDGRRALDCVSSPFSREQWLCSSLLMIAFRVAIYGPREIRMVLDHTWTERGSMLCVGRVFPCKVYINLNHRDSQIWVTACLWPSWRRELNGIVDGLNWNCVVLL
jgi:hypothetical protein